MKRTFRDLLHRADGVGAARSRQALDAAYWKALEHEAEDGPAPSPVVVPADLKERGFVVAEHAVRPARINATLAALEVVRREGWPAVFVWMLEAPWRCAEDVAAVVERVLGGAVGQLPRAWAHGVTSENTAGWPPHQDYRESSPTPQRLTAWLALTEANLTNGCMHVVPPSPLTRDFAVARWMAMEDVASMMHTVRALPASAGTVLMWEPTTVHWGGPRTEAQAPERWALSFEYMLAHVAPGPDDTPVLAPAVLPDFETRRRVVGKSLEVFAAPEREPLAARFAVLADALIH